MAVVERHKYTEVAKLSKNADHFGVQQPYEYGMRIKCTFAAYRLSLCFMCTYLYRPEYL